MHDDIALSLVIIFAIGITTQIIAWWLQIPAIVLLLGTGLLIGPVLDWIDPDDLFGRALPSVVSLAVAVILFEGGLSLDIRRLGAESRVVRNLLIIGAPVALAGIATAAVFIMGLPWPLGLLVGAILVVTGPTVTGPLLTHVRPTKRVCTVLEWEGVTIDPVGATLAVLVFEGMIADQFKDGVWDVIAEVAQTIGIGVSTGLLAGVVVVTALSRYWVPDKFANPFVLTTVLSTWALANSLQPEAGLVTVTVAGMTLASQQRISLDVVTQFHSDLGLIALSAVFIVLAAQVEPRALTALPVATLGFLAVLILIVRPVSVMLSTIRSALSWKERLFIGWTAPRGIVAAGVSSLFGVRMTELEIPGGELLVSLVFIVIVATVVLSGGLAAWLAEKLGVRKAPATGFLFVGAPLWARELATSLAHLKVETIMIDPSWEDITAARMTGLRAEVASALSPFAAEELDLEGIGTMLAVTPNDHNNALATLRYRRIFGSAHVYQLAPDSLGHKRKEPVANYQRGRILFGNRWTYNRLTEHFAEGAQAKRTSLTNEFNWQDFCAVNQESDAIVCFVHDTTTGITRVFHEDERPPNQGNIIVSLTRQNTGTLAYPIVERKKKPVPDRNGDQSTHTNGDR